MVGKNQRTVFRKKRKKFFTGVRKQDLSRSESITVYELDKFARCSPAKKNCSLDKIPVMETIHLKKLNIQGLMQEE